MIVHAELELVHASVDAVSQDRDVILAEVEKTILGLGRPLRGKHKLRAPANVPAAPRDVDGYVWHRIIRFHPCSAALCVEQPAAHRVAQPGVQRVVPLVSAWEV